MSNLKLAEEHSQKVIASLDELIKLAKRGELKDLYLVIEEVDFDQDYFSLSGKPEWELSGEFDNITASYLFSKLFTQITGMKVHFA